MGKRGPACVVAVSPRARLRGCHAERTPPMSTSSLMRAAAEDLSLRIAAPRV
jgi:hypothetical protein